MLPLVVGLLMLKLFIMISMQGESSIQVFFVKNLCNLALACVQTPMNSFKLGMVLNTTKACYVLPV